VTDPSRSDSPDTSATPDTPTAGGSGARAPGPASPGALFLAFTRLALHGFGGVLPWAQREIVEQRGWLSREEFAEMLAFGQLLPGPNVINLAIMLGDRYFGWRGALAGLAGMLLVPMMVVLSMALVYHQVIEWPVVQRAMSGMSAVAAGLIMATGLKLALALRGRWRWLAFGVAAFVGVGLLHLPLGWVFLALGPAAVGLAWWAAKP
jgi:chromate transporter